jgi:hypothetical protein
MKRLKDTELIDLLDEKREVSELDPSDAEQLEDAKLAMMALKAWEEAEPVAVSPDFWPKLRDKLPERPARSPLGSFASTLAAWLWPSQSPLAASMRVAILVAIVALASFWFAPQNQSTPVVASDPAAVSFIQRSLKKHDNYVVAQPKDGGPAIHAGDAGAAENGDTSPKSDYVP